MKRYTMFMVRNPQYCHNLNSLQIDLQIQKNPNQNLYV